MLRKHEVISFLESSGWEAWEACDKYIRLFKQDSIGVDVGCDHILFLDDHGIFMELDICPTAIYAVIGFMLRHGYVKQDDVDKWIHSPGAVQ